MLVRDDTASLVFGSLATDALCAVIDWENHRHLEIHECTVRSPRWREFAQQTRLLSALERPPDFAA